MSLPMASPDESVSRARTRLGRHIECKPMDARGANAREATLPPQV